MKDDTISRAAAIDAMMKLQTEDIEAYGASIPEGFDGDRAVTALKALPPAQPGWIPCSERMPEEHEWIGTKKFGTTISNEVYVTFEAPNGERFAKHISFQNGKLSSVDEQRMKVWYKGAKPIAWCPLPAPWKGGQDERSD